tara:strand:+ start:126 stop:593 length:468 start_codon:yes stop_codon:yes gene_type:complete
MTLDELYQFERWTEEGFAAILAGVCPKIYASREPCDLESPRVEIKAVIGPALQHSKSFTSGSTDAYDAFEAALEITIVTNRTGNEWTMNHPRLIGSVRSRLTMRYLIGRWSSPVVVPADLRATGTADTFSDENDIDTTSLTYYLVFNVAPTAWPT